ncbi:MAG: NADH:flavin oxidoreductase [Fusobacteriaceae bacterium]
MKNIFDKTKIKNMELKNRIIRSAIWEGFSDENGNVTDELIEFYKKLSLGGVGTIITGFSPVIEYDKPAGNMIGVCSDKYIEGLKKLTKVVHENNTNIVLQIVVGGSQGRPGMGSRVVGPSPHINSVTKQSAEELSKEEIKNLIEAFSQAGRRAKEGNFDGVQIHGAHGYLISQFMNPFYNKRNDEYGGNIENRTRFLFEVYRAIRKTVGEFPIFVKINCEDFMEGGATKEEMLWVCKKLSEEGIDLIEVSGGNAGSRINEGVIRSKINSVEKEGYFKEFGMKLAKEISTPIALVGGHRSLKSIDEILNTSNISYISLARPLLREPDLVNIWKLDREKVSKCISCNKCLNPKGSICIFL